MLPILTLNPGDNATFDTAFDAARLLPPAATEADAGFAAILALRTDVANDLNVVPGQALPLHGNTMPLEAVTDDALAAVGEPRLVAADSPFTAGLPIDASLPVAAGLPVAADPPAIAGLPVAANLPAGTGLPNDANLPATPPHPAAVEATRTAAPPAAALGASAASATILAQAAPAHTASTPPNTSPVAASAASAGLFGTPRAMDTDPRPHPAALSPQPGAADADLPSKHPTPEAVQPRSVGPTGPQLTAGFEVQRQDTADSVRLPSHAVQMAPTASTPSISAPPTVAPSDLTGDVSAARLLSQPIDVPMRASAWGDQLGERVLLMAGNKLQSADIRLTPPELGPLRVQLSVDDAAASVTFHAQHAVTRDAIEQALPRLRDMLADNGITLGQASIGDQGVQHGGHDRDTNTQAAVHADAEEALDVGRDDAQAPRDRGRSSNALIDTFA